MSWPRDDWRYRYNPLYRIMVDWEFGGLVGLFCAVVLMPALIAVVAREFEGVMQFVAAIFVCWAFGHVMGWWRYQIPPEYRPRRLFEWRDWIEEPPIRKEKKLVANPQEPSVTENIIKDERLGKVRETCTEYEGVLTSFSIRELTTYQNDQKHGPYERYNHKNVLIEKGEYVKGKKSGRWERYYGSDHIEGSYVQGKFVGKIYESGRWEQKRISCSGQIKDWFTWKRGKTNGPMERYDRDGKLTESGVIKGNSYTKLQDADGNDLLKSCSDTSRVARVKRDTPLR